MILRSVIVLTFLVLKSNGLNINGKNYVVREFPRSDGIITRIVYPDTPPKPWVARSVYNQTYMKTGWDTFDIETNPEIDDAEQAFLAGYLEGVETQPAIYDHFSNTIPSFCDDKKLCQKVQKYLDSNTQWVKEMIKQHAASDIYWRQVNLFYQQMAGLLLGYNSIAPTAQKLDLNDIMWVAKLR